MPSVVHHVHHANHTAVPPQVVRMMQIVGPEHKRPGNGMQRSGAPLSFHLFAETHPDFTERRILQNDPLVAKRFLYGHVLMAEQHDAQGRQLRMSYCMEEASSGRNGTKSMARTGANARSLLNSCSNSSAGAVDLNVGSQGR